MSRILIRVENNFQFMLCLVVVKTDYVLGGHWGSSVCLDYLEVWTDKQVHISNQYFFRRKVRFFL